MKLSMRNFLPLVISLVLIGCSHDAREPAVEAQVSAADGGTVTSSSGALTITIPPGALGSDTAITIEPISLASLPPEFADLDLTTVQAYELGPSGLTFNSPISITLQVNSGLVQSADGFGYGETFLLLTSDGSTPELLENMIHQVDLDNGTVLVTGSMTHFSPLLIDRAPPRGNFTVSGIVDELEIGSSRVMTAEYSADDLEIPNDSPEFGPVSQTSFAPEATRYDFYASSPFLVHALEARIESDTSTPEFGPRSRFTQTATYKCNKAELGTLSIVFSLSDISLEEIFNEPSKFVLSKEVLCVTQPDATPITDSPDSPETGGQTVDVNGDLFVTNFIPEVMSEGEIAFPRASYSSSDIAIASGVFIPRFLSELTTIDFTATGAISIKDSELEQTSFVAAESSETELVRNVEVSCFEEGVGYLTATLTLVERTNASDSTPIDAITRVLTETILCTGFVGGTEDPDSETPDDMPEDPVPVVVDDATNDCSDGSVTGPCVVGYQDFTGASCTLTDTGVDCTTTALDVINDPAATEYQVSFFGINDAGISAGDVVTILEIGAEVGDDPSDSVCVQVSGAGTCSFNEVHIDTTGEGACVDRVTIRGQVGSDTDSVVIPLGNTCDPLPGPPVSICDGEVSCNRTLGPPGIAIEDCTAVVGGAPAACVVDIIGIDIIEHTSSTQAAIEIELAEDPRLLPNPTTITVTRTFAALPSVTIESTIDGEDPITCHLSGNGLDADLGTCSIDRTLFVINPINEEPGFEGLGAFLQIIFGATSNGVEDVSGGVNACFAFPNNPNCP